MNRKSNPILSYSKNSINFWVVKCKGGLSLSFENPTFPRGKNQDPNSIQVRKQLVIHQALEQK